jgi:hypothetical protein
MGGGCDNPGEGAAVGGTAVVGKIEARGVGVLEVLAKGQRVAESKVIFKERRFPWVKEL